MASCLPYANRKNLADSFNALSTPTLSLSIKARQAGEVVRIGRVPQLDPVLTQALPHSLLQPSRRLAAGLAGCCGPGACWRDGGAPRL